MIAVILPTRGLVFSQVEDSISRNLAGYNYKIYRSFTLPIPDCQNFLVEKALEDNPTHILFVEEDTVMPDGGFKRLLSADADIACIDYAVNGYSCITKNRDGEILWCGLGSTLVKSVVFDKLEKPYFRSDKLLLLNVWPNIEWIDAGEQGYGGQDIYFCIKAREAGFKIKQVEGECEHLKLVNLGRPEINKGLHQIEQKEIISKHQIL